MIEAGADLVFGHSAHIFRGIEIYPRTTTWSGVGVYQGKPILYSTGDFVDDYAVDEIERNDQSFIFMVEIADGKTKSLRLYLTLIADFQDARTLPKI